MVLLPRLPSECLYCFVEMLWHSVLQATTHVRGLIRAASVPSDFEIDVRVCRHAVYDA